MKKTFLLASLIAIVVAPAARADIFATFDTADGFTIGSIIDGQNGWTQFAASTTQPTVEGINPFSGDGHLRIADDTTIADGTLTGGFSPLDNVSANRLSNLVVQMSLDDQGGADYDVVGQSPTEGFLSYRMKFSFSGDILVLDDIGAGLAFQDTGFDWVQAQYNEVEIDFNPSAGTIDYFYGGNLVYTGGLVAGTRVEQVILLSDNFQGVATNAPAAFGDFDELSLVQGVPEPGSIVLVTLFGLAAVSIRKRR